MAADQTVKYVDVSRSFLPMDPNSFPDGLHIADIKEEDRVPIMAYDGKNIMPTAYGYKNFFGLAEHPADALTENVDAILIFQNSSLSNILVALTASGIWYKAGSEAGAWVQEVVMTDSTESGTHYPWTFCVLNNKLICYRSNGDHYYEISSIVPAPGIQVVEKTPTFLNMTAQLGMFRAGNRLGFWDSDDSVAWSSLDDFSIFDPDLSTLAGSSKFNDVMGRIVSIRTHGEGFIIYSTKSVVFVQKSESSLFLWDPVRILENTGIAYMEEVVEAVPNTTHYAYCTDGVYQIKNANPELIVPEVADFFKLFHGPKYLRLLESRFLFFQILDEDFENAFPQFSDVTIPPTTIVIGDHTFDEIAAMAQGTTPTVAIPDLLNLIADGTFNPVIIPGEGGGGPVL